MAKRDPNPALMRIQRTEAYAEKIRLLFAQTVNEILALNKTMPVLEDGVMFSFDAESVRRQKEVEVLLRRLHSAATLAIQNGVKVEWDIANRECDKLVGSVFGKKLMESTEFSAWMQRNDAARDAFINRTEKGLNLSDRVWQSVRQLRDEMEVAMTVAIGEGESASSMSRKVRQYLNDPDLMFRRFRFKKDEDADGNPVWGRKWKKRIKDEATGKYKWIDYDKDDYPTGRGVYKSSAKNAMRVARTETNIAYRRADHERWEQMDFILGQRVQLSRSHPKKDICDKLAGDYPKEFVFDGWHPQCFCYVTPITIPPEDTEYLTEMFLNGEDWKGEMGKLTDGKEITEYPENFKSWVADHAKDIAKAREKGTEPYFIRNNAKIVDRFMGDGKDIHDQIDTSTPEKKTVSDSVLSRKEYDSLDAADWEKVNFFDKSGGYVVKHILKERDDMTRAGIAAEVNACTSLAMEGKHVMRLPENVPSKIDDIVIDGTKYRDLLKFKNGKTTPRGYPDAYFDGQTWDFKVSEYNNISSLRQQIKDGRKADNIIFIGKNKSDVDVIKEAVSREVGSRNNDGSWHELPNIYFLMNDKLECIWKN